jgi:hypothetical protein
MEEDAFETAVNYASAEELKIAKEKYGEGGKVNMCTAIQELMADSRNEGIDRGELKNLVFLVSKKKTKNYTVEETADMLETDPELVQKLYDMLEKYDAATQWEEIINLIKK